MSASELAGRRVLVVGLARAGTAAADALARTRAPTSSASPSTRRSTREGSASVGVEVHVGREEETLAQGIDLVVKSPESGPRRRWSRRARARCSDLE